MSDPQNRRSIADFVQNLPERVFPVGRLDFNTEGLLLLTNDGALAQALMHPSHEVNKTYLVKVPGIVPQEKLDQLRLGVSLRTVRPLRRLLTCVIMIMSVALRFLISPSMRDVTARFAACATLSAFQCAI